MTRLAIAWLLALASVLVGVTAFYVIYDITHGATVDAAVLGAFATLLGAIVYKGAVAIKNRNYELPDA